MSHGRDSSGPLPAAGCLLLLAVAAQLDLGPHIRLSQWRVPPDANESWLEARAWLADRADIGVEGYDHARVDGRWYNPLPPLFTLICAGAMLLARLSGEAAADGSSQFFPPLYVLCVYVAPLLSGFWALREAIRGANGTREPHDSAWAALLTFCWLTGTSMAPTLLNCRDGNLNYINHALSQIGLFLLAGDLLGRRRVWPAALGLLIAAWSRQMTLGFALPWLWLLWREGPAGRVRRVGVGVTALVVASGGLMAVNALRFGDPLENGYRFIYPRRTAPSDLIAARAREYGLFSVRCIPFNAWHMNGSIPSWEWSAAGPRPVNDGPEDKWGASIWFASPLLLGVFIDLRRWVADPRRRALMLGSLLVIFGVLCYHNSGAAQFGHFRFSLDVAPVWLAVLAPFAAGPRRTAWTLACCAWSAWYFSLLLMG